MELRPAREDEFEAFSTAVLTAFHEELTDDERKRYMKIHEPARSLAWYDEGRVVATSSLFTRDITVPGGRHRARRCGHRGRRPAHPPAPRAAHRDDAPAAREHPRRGRADRGALGVGGRDLRPLRLRRRRPDRRAARAAPGGPARRAAAGRAAGCGRASRASTWRPCARVHARVVPTRPGMLTRPGPWWDERLYETGVRARRARTRCARSSSDDAYAALRGPPQVGRRTGRRSDVVVREVVAATREGHAAIWSYLLDLDLTATVSWELAPSDEPLWLALTDPRAVKRTLWDALWIRIVDIPAALAARAYAADPDVVLEVRDGFCPWNEGRYRLAAGGCDATGDEPDLVLDAGALGAAYLGGTLLQRPRGRGPRRGAHARQPRARVRRLPRRRRALVPRDLLRPDISPQRARAPPATGRGARPAAARDSRSPCASSQPCAASASQLAGDATPSPTTRSPSRWPRSTVARDDRRVAPVRRPCRARTAGRP